MQAHLSDTKMTTTTYLRGLIEADLNGSEHSPALDLEAPIGDLIKKHCSFLTKKYKKAIKESEPYTDEGTLLQNLLDQSIKLLTTSDRADFAIMSYNELRCIVLDAINLQPTEIELPDFLHTRIQEVKRLSSIIPESLDAKLHGIVTQADRQHQRDLLATEDPKEYPGDQKK